MSSARIPLAGVIGSPIAHSRSPCLHGHWLERHGLAGFYVPMDVDHTDLKTVMRALPSMGFVGVNVTVPHKEAVIALADQVSDRAAVMGAANTVTFSQDGRMLVDNTDGYGFLENLRAGAPSWTGRTGPATVLGAGGAARAVIVSLLEAGVPEIRLSNRTRTRAEALRDEFGTRITVFDWVHVDDAMEGTSLLVNTTSLGMTGKPPLKLPLDSLPKSAVVSDLVYAPLTTDLLRAAASKGCTIVDGLGMLLYQAVPAFERWFGVRPVVDDDLRRAVLAG